LLYGNIKVLINKIWKHKKNERKIYGNIKNKIWKHKRFCIFQMYLICFNFFLLQFREGSYAVYQVFM